MFEDKNHLFENFEFNSPILKKEIDEVEKILKIKFPNDYVEFMLETNGGEGSIGEESYLRLWKINEIIEHNISYSVEKFSPGLVIIGSDGSGTAYGFDFREQTPKLIEVDFIGMDLDYPFYSTNYFFDFIEYLFKK